MFRKKLAIILTGAALASFLSFSQSNVSAQTSSATDIVLVLPFENVSSHPEYNWIGESFADSPLFRAEQARHDRGHQR